MYEQYPASSAEQSPRYRVTVAEALAELQAAVPELSTYVKTPPSAPASQESDHFADPPVSATGAREFRLRTLPTVAELQALAQLPFEVSITELDDDLVLSTGDYVNATHTLWTEDGPRDLVDERHDTSAISFHTHPVETDTPAHYPSLSDLLSAAYGDPDFLIGSPDRIVRYELADDVTGEEILEILQTASAGQRRQNDEPISPAEWDYLRHELLGRLAVNEYLYSDPDTTQVVAELFSPYEESGE